MYYDFKVKIPKVKGKIYERTPNCWRIRDEMPGAAYCALAELIKLRN